MLRKIAIAISAAAALFCALCCVTAYAEDYKIGRYAVADPSAGVYSTCDASGVLICELYGGESADIVNVTQIKNGSGLVFIPSENQSGWVSMKALKYLGEASQFTAISVTAPVKTSYIDGEESFDASGLKVYAASGSGKTEVTGYQLFVPPLNGVGKKTVRVTYTPEGTDILLSTQFQITVTRVPVVSAVISKKPSKLTYIENEKLDLTGLEITVSFSDGRANEKYSAEQILKDGRFSISACHSADPAGKLTPGTHYIDFSYKYKEISARLTVSVRERTVTSFKAVKMPDTAAYYEGEDELVLDGIELSAKFDNGEKESVPLSDCEIVFDKSNAVIGSNNSVTIKYMGKSISFNIEVIPNELIGVKLTPPAKTV